MSAVLTISFYKDYEKVEFVVTGEAGIDVSVKMSFETLIHLGSFGFSPVAGLYISCDLDFKLSFDVTLSLHFDVIFTEGFEFSTLTKKFTSIRNFDFNSEIKIEGKISIGFVITPKVSVVTESFITIQLPISPMFVITATTAIDTTTGTIDTENHDCDYCIDGSTDFEITAQAKLVFFNSKRFTYSLPKLKVDFHLFDFYFSLTHSEFGLGKCPYSKSITVSGKCGDSLTWGIDEEEGILYIDGSGNMTDFDSEDAPWAEYKKIIKTVYIGKEVTSIGNNAFEKCSKIKYVYFYGTETQWKQITIGTNNKYLTDAQIRYLDLSDPGTDINPEDADGKCGDNVYWSFDESTGTLKIFGTGEMDDYYYTSEIPWYSYRDGITSVSISNSVTSIGNYAFHYCPNLTSVTIGNGVTSIGSDAFSYCTSLTSVTIPDSVTSIDDYAFSYCTSLTSVTVDKNNKNYSSDRYGVLFNKDKTTLIQYPIGNTRTIYAIPDSVTSIGCRAFCGCSSLTSVTIPDSVTSIGNYAFHYCPNLTSVTIGNGVTSIGSDAFSYCTSLTSVTIPDSVTSIDDYAFSYCTSLTSITIPDSVTSIGEAAFDSCRSLTNISIPDSVTSIGKRPFNSCTSLTSITVDNNNKKYSSDKYGVLFNKDKTTLIQYPIGNARTSYTIPDSVTSIGDYAFYNCTSLTSVTIPDSVTSIDSYTFCECSSLTRVTIPDSVTSIGDWAFSNCTSLTDVHYTGTEAQWNSISIGSYNDYLTNATIHYNYNGASVQSAFSLTENVPVTYSLAYARADVDTDVISFAYGYCIADNKYVVLNVLNYCDDFELTMDNLLFIDVVTADENGNVDKSFEPIYYDNQSTTLLIGDFGNGVETIIIYEPEKVECKIYIQEPSRTTIRCKDGIYLYPIVDGGLPEGTYIYWETSNDNFDVDYMADDSIMITSQNDGYTDITVYLLNYEDDSVIDSYTIEMYSKAGFFDKIGGFFRSLFGSTKIYEY